MHPLLLASDVVAVEHVLHGLEDLLRNQRRVVAWVDGPLPAQHPGVIRVAERTSRHRSRNRLRRHFRSRNCGQPSCLQRLGERRQAPLPSGVGLEGPLHEGPALLVDLDTANLDALDAADRVEVADRRLADRAPRLDLADHLVLELVGQVVAVVLVDRAKDGEAQLPGRGAVDRLRAAHQLCSLTLESLKKNQLI